MRAVSLFVLVGLLGVGFAGCVDDDVPVDEPVLDVEPVDEDDETGLTYAVGPNANESEMDGAHEHDAWHGQTELDLLSGTVYTSECGDHPFMEVALLMFGVFTQQAVQKGCAEIHFEESVIVPEGTAKLHVTLGAADALVAGGMQLYFSNEQNRFVNLAGTTEAEHTWTIGMEAVEWDAPHSLESSWSFFVRPDGDVAVLDGAIEVTIVAERLPDWEPILGSKHLDHWQMPTMHSMLDGGKAMRLLDDNVTITFPSYADRITGKEGSEGAPLQDIVPPNTAQVTLTVVWQTPQGCPVGHECWVVPYLNTQGGGNQRARFQEPVEAGDGWAVYLFDSPDPLAPDSTYAEESVWEVNGFIRSCPTGEPVETPIPFVNGCQGEAVSSMSAETRIEVEAWKDSADLEAVKQRLDIS